MSKEQHDPSVEQRQFHCGECGGHIERHDVFCPKCGKKLDHFDFDD